MILRCFLWKYLGASRRIMVSMILCLWLAYFMAIYLLESRYKFSYRCIDVPYSFYWVECWDLPPSPILHKVGNTGNSIQPYYWQLCYLLWICSYSLIVTAKHWVLKSLYVTIMFSYQYMYKVTARPETWIMFIIFI